MQHQAHLIGERRPATGRDHRFGGGEAMRLVAGHPSFELTYAAGEGSVGSRLVDRFPGVTAKLAELVIEK